MSRPGTTLRGRRRLLGEERGSVTVIVAVAALALGGLLALGIDLGALFNARSEAQRAADAAALAGASAFLDMDQARVRQIASNRAVEFATSNAIRNSTIDPEEVMVWVNPDSATVRAEVRRNALPTWFARLLGVDSVDVAAQATAWAGEAGAAQCVKPFAVPDMWDESSDDLNGNRVWDPGETWRFDPGSGDRYDQYSGPGGSLAETGYGSSWRDGQMDGTGRDYDRDYGRRITVKVTNPRETFMPSFFFPWVLPHDPDQASCGPGSGPGGGVGNGGGNGGNGGGNGGNGGNDGGDTGGGTGGETGDDSSGGGSWGWLKWWEKRDDLGNNTPANPPGQGGGNGGGNGGGGVGGGGGTGGSRGAAAYRRNICSCNTSVIDLDTEYLIEPGNMVGPTHQGVSTLIAQDPDAYWDERTNSVVSQYGMKSPRVITVALFDPAEIERPGRQYIRFNNFARVFIEEQISPQDPVTGRFLYYVPGVGQSSRGNTTGSLVRVLQLIK